MTQKVVFVCNVSANWDAAGTSSRFYETVAAPVPAVAFPQRTNTILLDFSCESDVTQTFQGGTIPGDSPNGSFSRTIRLTVGDWFRPSDFFGSAGYYGVHLQMGMETGNLTTTADILRFDGTNNCIRRNAAGKTELVVAGAVVATGASDILEDGYGGPGYGSVEILLHWDGAVIDEVNVYVQDVLQASVTGQTISYDQANWGVVNNGAANYALSDFFIYEAASITDKFGPSIVTGFSLASDFGPNEATGAANHAGSLSDIAFSHDGSINTAVDIAAGNQEMFTTVHNNSGVDGAKVKRLGAVLSADNPNATTWQILKSIGAVQSTLAPVTTFAGGDKKSVVIDGGDPGFADTTEFEATEFGFKRVT